MGRRRMGRHPAARTTLRHEFKRTVDFLQNKKNPVEN